MPIPVPGRTAEALRKSTVEVRSGGRRWQGNGSGVAIRPDQVITNAHVIHSGSLTLVSYEGTAVSASVLKMDRVRDLALLAGPRLGAAPASLGDSDELRVGTPIIAVGNPLGFVGAVSTGTVYSIGPAPAIGGHRWIQADLRLAPGNSGGPLADLKGRIIGINTMIAAGGLALAIPSRTVQSFLSRTNSPRTLGVVVRPVHAKDRVTGMMILELVPGGAAERASLLPGDILVNGNDRPLRFFDDLQSVIDEARAGLLHLNFHRGGQHKLRQVAVRLLPEPRMQTSSAA